MANDLSAVIPQLLAQGLKSLREQCVMPALVNRGYEPTAGKKGSTIDVPIPSSVTAVAVTPGPTVPANVDDTPETTPIALDQWYEAPFQMSDKDEMEAMEGYLPMRAGEAIKALANNVNSYIFSKYKGIYGYTGTAGTTPFGTGTIDATRARVLLAKQLAPMGDRRIVLNPDAEGNALELRAFQDYSWSNSGSGIIRGEIDTKLGFSFHMDQLVPTHTAGTITTGLIAKASTAQAVGDKTIVCTTAASTGACALLTGDIVSFAGHNQTYVLTAAATQASAASDVTLNIYPGLKTALAGSEAVTVRSSHVVNLAFHRDAFAFASRPLENVRFKGGSEIQSIVDSVSGLALRLEVNRQHKQVRWSYDILYGAALIRPELAVRIAG